MSTKLLTMFLAVGLAYSTPSQATPLSANKLLNIENYNELVGMVHRCDQNDLINLTDKQIERQILKKELQSKYQEDIIAVNLELARDASRTESISKTALLGGAVAPAAAVGGISVLTLGVLGESTLIAFSGVGIMVGGGGYGLYRSVRHASSAIKGDTITLENALDNYAMLVDALTAGNCDFTNTLAEVKEIRKQQMSKFNSRVWSKIRNAFTFGDASADITLKLLQLSMLEKVIYDVQLAQLKSLQ